jgi:hypothetical protein
MVGMIFLHNVEVPKKNTEVVQEVLSQDNGQNVAIGQAPLLFAA